MAAKKDMSRSQSMDPFKEAFDVDPNDASVAHSALTMRERWAGREATSVAPAIRLSRSLTSPAMNQRSPTKISFVRGEAISVGLGWTRVPDHSKLPGVEEEVSEGISSLPDACLIQIMANVTGLTAYMTFKLVSKRWCNLATGALRSLQVNNIPQKKLLPLLHSLRNFSNLSTLHLTQQFPNVFDDEMLTLLGKSCPQLKTLHFSFPDSDTLESNKEAGGSLTLESTSDRVAGGVSAAGFDALFKSCVSLKELTIACIDSPPSSTNCPVASAPSPIPAPLYLPDSVGQLHNLSAFALYSHRVVGLPDTFGKLGKLRELSLSCQNLVNLPNTMGQLVKLETLNLSSCKKLEALPDSLSGLERLSKITLKSCHSLIRLPEGLGGMANLTTLDCQDCESLKNLPDSLGDSEELTSLDLQGCSTLGKLPRNLSNAYNLQSINILGCVALKVDPVMIEDLRFSSFCHFQGLEPQVGFLCR